MEMKIIPIRANELSYDDTLNINNAGKIYISNTLNIYITILNESNDVVLLYLGNNNIPQIMKDEDMRGRNTFTLFKGVLTLTNTKD